MELQLKPQVFHRGAIENAKFRGGTIETIKLPRGGFLSSTPRKFNSFNLAVLTVSVSFCFLRISLEWRVNTAEFLRRNLREVLKITFVDCRPAYFRFPLLFPFISIIYYKTYFYVFENAHTFSLTILFHLPLFCESITRTFTSFKSVLILSFTL